MYSFEEENGYDFVMRIADQLKATAQVTRCPADHYAWEDIKRLRGEIAEWVWIHEDMRDS